MLPLSDELIAVSDARELSALNEDYVAFGSKVSPYGIEVEAIKTGSRISP